MTERTTVHLPDDLIRRARRKALAEGCSLTALIEEGLRRIVNERPSAVTHRVLPPVSRARGRLMPGIDLDDSASLQAMEDAETARRVR
jgi:hypothetical protein